MTQNFQLIAEENNATKNDFFLNWLFNSNITIKLLYTDKSLYTVDYPWSAPDNIIFCCLLFTLYWSPDQRGNKITFMLSKKHIFIHIFRDFCIFFLMRRVCAPPTQLGWGSASKKGNFPMEQIRDTRGELASFQHHCFDIIVPALVIITIIIGNCLKVSQSKLPLFPIIKWF